MNWNCHAIAKEALGARKTAGGAAAAAADGEPASGDAADGYAARASSSSRVDLGLWAVSESLSLGRHADTVIAIARDDSYCYSGSREGGVLVANLTDGALIMRFDVLGAINCVAAHRGKLVLCCDDGHQATIQLWDVSGKGSLVQEISGIRKWNAPSAVAYMGYDRCFWVRDTTMVTLTWRAATAPTTSL